MNEIVKKNGLKFGLISGLISIALVTAMYSIDIELFGNFILGLFIILFYIGFGIYVVSITKKELNGNITFKDAFTTYFLFSLIGVLISNAFNYILFNFIDVSAKQQILEISITKTVEFMERFDTPKQAIKDAVKQMKENDQYSIGNIIKGSAFSLVISAIFGLIIAAIFKTRNRETI